MSDNEQTPAEVTVTQDEDIFIEEAKERLGYAVRVGDTVQDVVLRVVANLLSEQDELIAEAEARGEQRGIERAAKVAVSMGRMLIADAIRTLATQPEGEKP